MEKPQLRTRVSKSDLLSKVPLAEIAGQNRVLVENHQGILAYSTEEIQIKVSYGCIAVTGRNLHLMQMSKEQMIICGKIEGLQLFRR